MSFSSASSKTSRLEIGDSVIARDSFRGYYYQGKIKEFTRNRRACVEFDHNAAVCEISLDFIIIKPPKQQSFAIHDYVMAQVINEYNTTCWVPGVLVKIRENAYPKGFIVQYYNGRMGENHRQELIKMSNKNYKLAQENIVKVTPEKDLNKPENQSKVSFLTQLVNEPEKQILPVMAKPEETEEVLAQWPVDGWFYKAKVKSFEADSQNLLEVEFLFERILKINSKNVLKFVSSSQKLQEDDKVLALFPNYKARYAPGSIYKLANDYSSNYLVSFYDYTLKEVSRENIVRIDSLSYDQYVKYIKEIEKFWLGKTAVALNSNSGKYEIAKVVKQAENGGRYVIEFLDQTQIIQSSIHIFGPLDKAIRISSEPKHEQDFVLAPRKENIYTAGVVKAIKGNSVSVQFSDGTIEKSIMRDDCFWISRDYYQDNITFK